MGDDGARSREGRRGVVVAVCTSAEKGTPKDNVGSARLIEGHGAEGDAHAGPWHRQVSLLALESVDEMRRRGLDVAPGDFAENLTVSGLEVWSLPLGTKVLVGDEVVLEITQIGKECHSGCAVFKRVGDCVMPRKGVFARVLKGGTVKTGDLVRALEPGGQP